MPFIPRSILCNGQLLQLGGDHLPAIRTVSLPAGPTLSLPAYGIGFHVFRRAAPAACLRDEGMGMRSGDEEW